MPLLAPIINTRTIHSPSTNFRQTRRTKSHEIELRPLLQSDFFSEGKITANVATGQQVYRQCKHLLVLAASAATVAPREQLRFHGGCRPGRHRDGCGRYQNGMAEHANGKD